MSSEQQTIQIVSRISSIPIIASTFSIASDIYIKMKNYNEMVNMALTKTELSIMFVKSKTNRVTKKLEKPISIADTIACNGLDSLEKKVPVIKKSPNEIKGEALKQLLNFRSYGIKKLTIIKDMTVGEVYIVMNAPLMKFFNDRMVSSLGLIEKTMDKYLPPSEGNVIVEKKFLVQRLCQVPVVLQHRLVNRYNILLKKMQF